MVEVGDKVFVAPLYGQNDNIAVISGSAGGGITEGDYNTWTWKWTNSFTDDLSDKYRFDAYIDEVNEIINLAWKDNSNDIRFGTYNLNDFSVVYESPSSADYMWEAPYLERKEWFMHGIAYFYAGGISMSHQTYILLEKPDRYTIETWRGGASALWTRNTRTDLGVDCYCYSGGFSLTGKYILVHVQESAYPNPDHLMLYEGSSV